MAPVLMVQGAASSVGKSTLVAGLCRLFARLGVRVAPFKAQNMSNNAAACVDGGEIGRAQYVQALACGLEPTVDMNPILLKPQADAVAQVIIHGRVQGVQTAATYFSGDGRDTWPAVVASLDRLRGQYDLVIAEGAGSPAEINLRHRDVVNMRVARHTEADVLLVGDINLGGVFAALLGTWEWLLPEERRLVRGFVLNKFRGDAALLAPAPALLEQRTGVPVLGVVPYLADLGLPEEDAATLDRGGPGGGAALVETAVIHLPHIANFDEFGPLASELSVALRHVRDPNELRAPDLVILPGSKATIPDLLWLRERGLEERITWLADHGTPLLGVCGGLQMLGQRVTDPDRIESVYAEADGLGLLPVRTEIGGDKRVAPVRGTIMGGAAGFWSGLAGQTVSGYEIHQGRTDAPQGTHPFLRRSDGQTDGMVSDDGLIAGTYIHGVLENAPVRQLLVRLLAAQRGFAWLPAHGPVVDPLDRLADVLEEHLVLGADTLPVLGTVRGWRA